MSHPDDLITAEQAADILEVPVDQVHAMVEEGMLDPSGSDADQPLFRRADVIAVDLLGG
jgi:hypothetical protein